MKGINTVRILFLCGSVLWPYVVDARCECMNKILQLLGHGDDYRVVTSPEFPRPYCPDLNCIWQVVGPENTSKIHFFSKNIDLRQDRDFIRFYEMNVGMETTELADAAHSCTGSGPCQFKSNGQFLVIQFKTDVGEPDCYGFQGTVALYDPWISSASGFLIVSLISIVVTFAILGIIYFACLRQRTREPDRRLLAKDDDETKPMRENYLKP